MNKEQYLAQRNSLLEKAQGLLNENKFEEFNSVKEEIEKLDSDFENSIKEQANLNALKDNAVITNIQNKSVPVQGGKTIESTGNTISEKEDLTNSVEYRLAFMNYALNGTKMPAEFSNSNENTKTGDVGVVIPSTIIGNIVEKMEATGMILPLVTPTAIKGGVKVPKSSIKPVATWVGEGQGSDKQKKTVDYIDFGYNKLRCSVSMSLEVSVTTLGFFEKTFINNVSEAMVKALEQAIISGDGAGKPKGILTETVDADKKIEIAKDGKPEYKNLIDAEAALPLAYETGAVWFMTKKTFMAYAGLTDANGQPIGRINYGIGGKIERMILGRTVVCNDYMSNYKDTVDTDTVVAFLFNPKDYALNNNMNMLIKRYEDNETDDMVTKAIMLTDGKVLDNGSLVTITKKSA